MSEPGLDLLEMPQLLTDTFDRWKRTRRIPFVLLYLGSGAFIYFLWRSGYPHHRCVLAAALMLGSMILSTVQMSRPTWFASAVEGGSRALLLAMVLVTGGAHSPFLVASFGFLTKIFIQQGVTRYTLSTFGTFAFAGVAMCIAPPEWLGPQIADPLYTITTAVNMVVVATIHADYFTMLSGSALASVRALFAARESVAQLELSRTRRLETIASTLSHELKNPLGAIKALVQVSTRASADPAERKRLEVVESEVDRMNEILQGYLSFSRPLEPLERAPVELGGIVDEVLAVMEARAAKVGVTLRKRGAALANVDARRLKEALINLVANALEASPPRSAVELELTQERAGARIAIRDHGRGMTPEELARVGTPFFTTRPAGTGLGVSLARSVFSQHGGALEYTSTSGQGTTAVGTLPNPTSTST